MKVGIGGIYHETHTFSSKRTGFEDFSREIHIGKDILGYYSGTRTSMGGFIYEADKNGDEVVPVLYTAATPSSLISKEAFEKIQELFFSQLKQSGKLDAFLLAQHGAMCVEGFDDVEGYFLNKLKSELNDIPLIVTVDYHANISPEMVKNSDCIIGYDTYPHTDIFERAVDAYKVLEKAKKDKFKINNAYLHIPIIAAPQSITTESGIMKKAIRIANRFEKNKDIINITVAGGFAYSDIPYAGISVIVSFINNADPAKEIVLKLGNYIWERRRDFKVNNTKVADAVKKALTSKQPPIVLVDVADNIGGGAPGDGTELLRELVLRNATDAVVVIADKESVGKCIAEGVGKLVSLDIGGKTDNLHGLPVPVNGYIKLISDGEFVNSGRNMTGLKTRMGRTVLLIVNRIKIILTEFPTPPNDPEMLCGLGIDISRERILVVKGAIAWKTGIHIEPGDIIYVDTSGLCKADINSYNYKNIMRPVYPFDEFDLDLEKMITIF